MVWKAALLANPALTPSACPSSPRPAPAGPSSPRAQWPQVRGSVAEAAANALSKGSPRGVTPNGSTAFLPGAGGNGGVPPAVAAAAKLQKLSVGGAQMGGAPAEPIPNQVSPGSGWAAAGQRLGWAAAGLCLAGTTDHSLGCATTDPLPVCPSAVRCSPCSLSFSLPIRACAAWTRWVT